MIAPMEFLEKAATGLALSLYTVAADPGARVYAGYIIIGALIAFAIGGRETLEKGILDRAIWTSKSARIDYLSMVLNPLALALGWSALILNGEWVTSGVQFALSAFGPFALPSPLVWIAATLAVFLAHDLAVYVAHWLMHKIPALWEFHKFHHSAERLNVFTAHRAHPAELLVAGSVMALLIGGTNGVLYALIGPETAPATLAGANVVWIAANIAGGSLRHTEVWLSFGPRVERWIISPAMHQIHHSEAEKHWDKNLGATLAIWDRLFGTLYVTHGREELTYGFGEETPEFRTLKGAYLAPFAKAARALLPKRRDEPAPGAQTA